MPTSRSLAGNSRAGPTGGPHAGRCDAWLARRRPAPLLLGRNFGGTDVTRERLPQRGRSAPSEDRRGKGPPTGKKTDVPAAQRVR